MAGFIGGSIQINICLFPPPLPILTPVLYHSSNSPLTFQNPSKACKMLFPTGHNCLPHMSTLPGGNGAAPSSAAPLETSSDPGIMAPLDVFHRMVLLT